MPNLNGTIQNRHKHQVLTLHEPRITSNRLVETGHQSWLFVLEKLDGPAVLGWTFDAPVLAVLEMLSTLVLSNKHHKRGFNPVSSKSK